jgi:hypothetical protein
MRYIKRTNRGGEVASATGGVGRLPAIIHLRGHRCIYRVRAGRTIDGPVLLGLEIVPDRGYEITGADLKSIPAARLAAAAVNVVGVDPADDFEPEIRYVEIDFENFNTPERAWSGEAAKATVGRRPVHGLDHFVEVVKEAVKARGNAKSARAAIAKRWSVTPATADRWMREARSRGLPLPRSKRAPRIEKGTKTR